MKNLNFSNGQCVLIEYRAQYASVYHHMRSAGRYKNLREWESKHGIMTPDQFPFYLEWGHSVTRGSSIGITSEPFNTWTNKPLEVLTFKEATS